MSRIYSRKHCYFISFICLFFIEWCHACPRGSKHTCLFGVSLFWWNIMINVSYLIITRRHWSNKLCLLIFNFHFVCWFSAIVFILFLLHCDYYWFNYFLCRTFFACYRELTCCLKTPKTETYLILPSHFYFVKQVEIREKVTSAQEKLQSFQERLQSLMDHTALEQLTIIQVSNTDLNTRFSFYHWTMFTIFVSCFTAWQIREKS